MIKFILIQSLTIWQKNLILFLTLQIIQGKMCHYERSMFMMEISSHTEKTFETVIDKIFR